MLVRRRLLVRSLIVALLVSLAIGWWSSRDDETYELDSTIGSIALNKVSEGNLLASVDVEDVDGAFVSTETWVGRPLVVNFWFTTCEPCRREFPVLVSAAQRRSDLRFIGVNLNDSTDVARAFAASFGAEFEMFFDRDGRLTSAMGVATAPVTLLVDSGGLVRRQLTGEVTAPVLDAAIDEVFPS